MTHTKTCTYLVALLAGLVTLSPSAARARTRKCRDVTLTHRTRPPTFRMMAARFAPRLSVRIWFHVDTRGQQRDEAPTTRQSDLTNAPAPTPQPVQRTYYDDRPFGWQFSLRWDLAAVADSFVQDTGETVIPLRSSPCVPLGRAIMDAPTDSGGLP